MASCGDALIPCGNTSSTDTAARTCNTSSPTQSNKVAWGGAGVLPTTTGSGRSKNAASAWGPSVNSIPKTSFRDLQSEDLAKELTHRESAYVQPFLPGLNFSGLHQDQQQPLLHQQQSPTATSLADASPSSNADAASTSGITSTSASSASACGMNAAYSLDAAVSETDNDFAVARALQYEYDLEHDYQIELNERQSNKNSKLSISYNNHRVLPSFAPKADDIVQNDDDPVDEIEAGELEEPFMPPCGYVQRDGVIITKHDSVISARKNTKKMLNFLPFDVDTGDAGGFTINMPNKVFNNLNASTNSDKRKQRLHDKGEKGTLGRHLDEGTGLTLLSMVNAGALQHLGGIISTGKEAVVYQAVVGNLAEDVAEAEMSQDCVVKVFKTRLAEFKTRERYIRDDHRFKDRMSKTNSFSNIKLWVEKEYRNLSRVSSSGVLCPTPLAVKNNLLVMSLIGEAALPAPQIRTVCLSNVHWQMAYNDTLQLVDDMVNKCRLVHADLSEYNLLYHDNNVYVIDFAQAVDIAHPHALSYLYRDLCNVANFFHRKGVAEVKTGVDLLEEITKLDIKHCTGVTNTEQVEAAEHELTMWRGSDCYDDGVYEFLWNTAQIRQQVMQNLDFSDEELQQDLVNLTLNKTGSYHKEQWITKKTDSSVTNKGQRKKRKSRKNSGSNSKNSTTNNGDDSNKAVQNKVVIEAGSLVVNSAMAEDEISGFCLVNSSDCVGVDSYAEDCSTGNTSGLSTGAAKWIDGLSAGDRKQAAQRVRFDVVDIETDAVESEDYNADADTDDLDADTDDIDTDVNATDHDGDTEGYHADADDTDNNASDANSSHKVIGRRNTKGASVFDRDDSSDQQSSSLCTHRPTKTTSPDKRMAKKKNKKSKVRSGNCN